MLLNNILLGFIIFLMVLILGGLTNIYNELKIINYILKVAVQAKGNKIITDLMKVFDKGKKIDKIKIN